MARSGEFELIEKYFAPLAAEGSFGLRDDCAIVEIAPGNVLVVTQDALAAGVHFLPDDPPRTVAQKALRVNLSDLAAKGARPLAFSLALGLDADWREDWVSSFAQGLAADCAEFGVSLSGGDTYRLHSGPVISITAWGETIRASYCARHGAAPGDQLYVTNTIGMAAIGLLVRKGKLSIDGGELDRALVQSYLVPQPPVQFARAIAAHATASIDLSDGFAGDIAKLATASAVDFRIELTAVPLPSQLSSGDDASLLETMLNGGDDYQIAFTAPEAAESELQRIAGSSGVRLSRLGRAVRGEGRVAIVDRDGRQLSLGKGFSHFHNADGHDPG